jgi:hypothetical protein
MNPRKNLHDRLKEDLLGPFEQEETLWDYPTDVYLTGILFPRRSEVSPEENDQLQSEGGSDIDSNDVSRDEVSLSATKRPSSMGVSFVVAGNDIPKINISISLGTYKPEVNSTTDKNGQEQVSWKRQGNQAKIIELSLDFKSTDLSLDSQGLMGVGIYVRVSSWGNAKLVTVALVNGRLMGSDFEKQEYEQNCLFQSQIEISCSNGTNFIPRPIGSSAVDEDTKMAQLIYRDTVEYAVGHSCSAEWDDVEGEVTKVYTSWIPKYEVKAMSSSGGLFFASLQKDATRPVLSTKWLANTFGADLSEGLEQLPGLYTAWLSGEEARISELDRVHQGQGEKHIRGARQIAERMSSAILRLKNDKDMETAFRLANQAILVQRGWSHPDESPMVWRPFQLGFILLTLESLADATHSDRGVADLLWFPTGGGKTEAYLGLIAFLLFYRRLKYGDRGAGVCTIMRYTLRLLTIQQFQRAAALICACDAIRLGYFLPSLIDSNFGDIPFSLGLWVGKDSTPNNVQAAAESLAQDEAPNRPDQLKYCPMHPQARLRWKAIESRNTVYATCPIPDCIWHNQDSPVPVFTMDTDIYNKCPSLVLGTIDKFAQVARRKEARSLFGNFGQYRPPDFIIQDELHLIAGPLGTVAGLYEIAFDELCTIDGCGPKVIASTATIRQASSQIRALFNRQTCLFPPPILDAGNSGFAIETDKAPGRLYLGITTAGRSAKFTLQAVAASVLQAASSELLTDENRDDYWTTVTYFNSLRELGGALVLMQDDVVKSMKNIAKRRNETLRDVNEPQELTSRVSQTEIKDVLENLNRSFDDDGCYDIVLASNMISVGVDVPRLGVMLVNGQPKGIAEYIQATSRIGRRSDSSGGIVLTLYNNAKARDRSHYETFRTWHSALYREVEASSVTPFAPRSREKALHAVLVIMARHLIENLNANPRNAESHNDKILELTDRIINRAKTIDPEEADAVEEGLEMFLAEWYGNASVLRSYWTDRSINRDLLISAEKVAELKSRFGIYDGKAIPTPNSMRNVEPSTVFRLKKRLRN